MAEMRKWNTGTWEETSSGKGRWRLKGKVSKSPRQLGEIFGVQLNGKLDSAKYWRMYLDQYREAEQAATAQQCPFPKRAAMLMRAIELADDDGKAELQEALDATLEGDIMRYDPDCEVTFFDPDTMRRPKEPDWKNAETAADIAIRKAIEADLGKPVGLAREIDGCMDSAESRQCQQKRMDSVAGHA